MEQMRPRPDEALILAAQAGDRRAFGLLFERYARMVHGVCLAHAAAHEVDDLVQEVFLIALEKLVTLRNGEALGSWLAQIARHRSADLYRRRAPTQALSEDTGRMDPDRVAALEALAAIRKLPDAYRETLTLRLVEDLSGPEIAAQVGLTPESVRVNLHRGMQLLRQMLGWEPES
jgi:RNA polymerase sigma-70 factor (ECF subfamily)